MANGILFLSAGTRSPRKRVMLRWHLLTVVVTLALRTGAGVSSWAACTGDAAGPLRRNRSCVFADLIFRPPATFLFAASEPVDGAALRVLTRRPRLTSRALAPRGRARLLAPSA